MIKGSICQEDKHTNEHLSNDRISKSMKPCFTEANGETDKITIIIGDLTISFLAIDKTYRQKKKKERKSKQR